MPTRTSSPAGWRRATRGCWAMNDESAFFGALEQDRADAVTLSALADWYDEHDDAESAACLRWVVRRGRRVGKVPGGYYGDYFWELEEARPIRNDPPAQLPDALWRALQDNDEPHTVGRFKSYR